VCNGTMDSDEKSEKQMSIAWIILLIIGIPIVAIPVAQSFMPRYNGIAERSPRVKAVTQVKQLLFACRTYAADFEGVYPESLAILYPDYIDDESFFSVRDIDGIQIPMIYHPGFKVTAPPDNVLIESPLTIKGKKVIGYVNGRVVEVSAK